MYKVVTQAEFVLGGTGKRRGGEGKETSWKKEENRKIKEQQTGARRVSRRFESSQVLYEGGNYRGRLGERGRQGDG